MVEGRIEPDQLRPAEAADAPDRRVVSAAEWAIAQAAIAHIGALHGARLVGPLGDVMDRVLGDTGARLEAAVRAAGYPLGREGQA